MTGLLWWIQAPGLGPGWGLELPAILTLGPVLAFGFWGGKN